MRRRDRSEKHSLSCTDDEWERIGARASRRGVSSSAYVVECALAVDPANPGARASVAEEIQALLETVGRIEERVSGLTPETAPVLESLTSRIAFLTRRAMLEMIREHRDEDLVALLAIQFGEDRARALVDAFRASLPQGTRAP